MTITKTLGLSLFLTVCALVAPVVVEAHMHVEKSVPAANAVVDAPPPHIQIFFNEVPDLAVSTMTMIGPGATLVKLHVMDKSLMAVVDGDMPNGVYTVRWAGAGDDGHQQRGEFSFTLARK